MKDRQGAIRFGDWELRPRDPLNWELFHLRASSHGYGDGSPRWVTTGRYYSWNTFANALGFAADCELKAKASRTAMGLHEAIEEYRGIVDRLYADMDGALARAGKGEAR